MGSFSLSGGVEVFGFISPSNTTDQYPVIDPLYGIDGLRNVNTLSDLNLISTLRRRAGMLVGVSGGTIYYKLKVAPWNNTISDWELFELGSNFTGGTVTGATIFTNGLTANTISATTYENLPLDVFVTGGTFSGGDIIFTNNSGGTFNVSGISSFDTFVTGFSYNNNTFTISQNSGSSLSATINSVTGLTSSGTIQSSVISASTYTNLPADIFITGGTFNSNTDTLTLSRSSGSSITITGFTDTFVTGATFSGTSLIISQNENQPDVTANISTVSLSGALSSVTFNIVTTGGISASTISATTYQNLPTDVFVTGGTFSGGSLTFRNNTGGTFSVSGISSFDTFVTGFSYSNNTFTIAQNSGSSLSATINTVTGLTVNGNLSVTGNTNVRGLTGTTALISGSGQNILTIVGSGSTQPLFTVQGSSGELFSVTDSLVGSLFSVNDISGLPIIEIFSNNTILMGSYLAPSLYTTTRVLLSAGTNTIYSIPTSAYTGAFFEYTLISSGATGARSGNIMSIWSGSSVNFTETQTTDIGTTTDVTFNMGIVGSNAVLSSSATTAGWTVKTIIKSI
jgi:hypothetical protein